MNTYPNLPSLTKRASLREAAERWMDAHPQAMATFRQLAGQAMQRGRRFGIGLLTERVRWEMKIEKPTDGDCKIPNNHRAYIARRLVREMPGLTAFLTMSSTADERDDGETL